MATRRPAAVPRPAHALAGLALATASLSVGSQVPVRLSTPEDPWLLGILADGASGRCRLGGDRWLVFESAAANLVADDRNGSRDVFIRDRLSGALERASVDSHGNDAEGASGNPDVDASGRYVVFESLARLEDVPGVPLLWVFLRDRQLGSTRMIARALTPTGLGGGSAPRINATGTHVVFDSHSSVLVPGDSNNCSDIFRYTIATDSLDRVSLDAAGGQANGCSYRPDISDDGQVVVFESDAGNLVPGDTGRRDIFRKDLTTGLVTRLSEGPGGLQPDRDSAQPTVSGDGERVLFNSNARNLVPDDSNLLRDIFLWTLAAQPALVRVNQPPVGQSNNVSFDPVLSRDGERLVYQSFASNLAPGQLTGLEQPFRTAVSGAGQQPLLHVPGSQAHSPRPSTDGLLTCVETVSVLDPLDGNGAIADVVIHDAGSNGWLLQSRAESPQPLLEGNGASVQPDIAPDGRFVVFHSLATTLDGASIDGNPLADVYWLDRDSGQVERHPVAAGGQPPNGASSGATVSADGRFLAFASTASNLVGSDSDARSDILRLDRSTGALIELSVGLAAATGDSDQAHISDDGDTVAFRSADSSLVPGDSNAAADIFVWRQGQPLRRVSVSTAGTQADGASQGPRLSADGQWLVYTSDAGNLVPDDAIGGPRDVFRHHLGSGTTQRISTAMAGGSSDGASHAADIAATGQVIAYVTSATDVATGDRSGPDVVVWQAVTGTAVNASQGLPAEYTVVAESVRISDDGNQVLFQAWHQIGSAFPHSLWRYDVAAATLSLATRRGDDSAHQGAIDGFALDGAGLQAVFASTDGELVAGDHNGHADVFQVGLGSTAGSIGLLPQAVTVTEGDCPALITLRRTGGSAGAVSVGFATVPGSATAGQDFVARSGTAKFADGDPADQAIAITIVDDNVVEPDETFTVELADPTGGVALGPVAIATITIIDNDAGDAIFGSGFEPGPACPDRAMARGRGVRQPIPLPSARP